VKLDQLNQEIKVSTSKGWLMSSFYCNDLNPLSLNYNLPKSDHCNLENGVQEETYKFNNTCTEAVCVTHKPCHFENKFNVIRLAAPGKKLRKFGYYKASK